MAIFRFWGKCLRRGLRPSLEATDLLLLFVPAVGAGIAGVSGYEITINASWWVITLSVFGFLFVFRVMIVAPVDLYLEASNVPGANAEKPCEHEQRPDAPIWRAVLYVSLAINEKYDSQCWPKARQAIRQTAIDGKIHLRGRKRLRSSVSRAKPTPISMQNTGKITRSISRPPAPHVRIAIIQKLMGPIRRTAMNIGLFWSICARWRKLGRSARMQQSRPRNPWKASHGLSKILRI